LIKFYQNSAHIGIHCLSAQAETAGWHGDVEDGMADMAELRNLALKKILFLTGR
jgi:hypothetical protein